MQSGVVFVGNKGTEAFRARFDGQDYEFPAGQTVPIDAAAAAHIFGYGLGHEARVKAFKRYGYMPTAGDEAKGHAWLATFTFAEPETPAIPDLTAEESEVPPDGEPVVETDLGAGSEPEPGAEPETPASRRRRAAAA